MSLPAFWLRAKEWFLPARQLLIIDGDTLPNRLPKRNLVLLREGGEDWSVGFQCPCGCGQRVELPLISEANPKWNLKLDKCSRPSIYPSVWLREGCRSHFFIKVGKVLWV